MWTIVKGLFSTATGAVGGLFAGVGLWVYLAVFIAGSSAGGYGMHKVANWRVASTTATFQKQIADHKTQDDREAAARGIAAAEALAEAELDRKRYQKDLENANFKTNQIAIASAAAARGSRDAVAGLRERIETANRANSSQGATGATCQAAETDARTTRALLLNCAEAYQSMAETADSERRDASQIDGWPQ